MQKAWPLEPSWGSTTATGPVPTVDGGRGADHVGGEAVQPVPGLLLFVVEFHGELGHVPSSGDPHDCYLR